MKKKYFVYILKCSDGSYYTGMTNNFDRRFKQHQAGINKDAYTFSRRPLEVVYFVYFYNPNEAIAFEKQIKGWTRKKKEALIEDNWDNIVEFSKCLNETSHLNFNKDLE